MQKLLQGVLTFRRHMFSAYRDLFERLASGQEPEALFITCSDSRVVPNLITATDPGDLFVLRNIGNIIPPFDPQDRDNAEAAALEYALSVLRVKDIVICGHSACGAMRAACLPQSHSLSHVRSWLRHVDPALELLRQHERVLSQTGPLSEPARIDLLSELSVLTQLKHIKTYPLAMERLQSGDLHLHGWFFEIDSAQLYTYNPVEEQFLPILTERGAAPRPLSRPAPGAAIAKSA